LSRVRKALLHSSLLLLALGIAAWLYLDRIVGTAIEKGGSAALGVPTHVGGVQLALLRGHVGLSGFAIDNPSGFGSQRFLQLGSIRAEIPPSALREDTVVIPLIELEGLELSLEGSRQGTNYGRILQNAAGAGGSPKTSGKPSSQGGKRFVVRELVVRDVKAKLAMSGFGSELASTSIEVPEIRLRDLGSGTQGVQLAELIAHITRGVVQSVVRKQPELAGALGGELRGRIEGEARKARETLERFGGALRREE
jgi:uncharacterized protein involved in outer membrane biogenesis